MGGGLRPRRAARRTGLGSAGAARKPGWPERRPQRRVRSLSASSFGSPAACASCAAPATSRLVAGSSSPQAASSSATELRRTSAASRAARAVSTRACRRSILPARQDT